MKTDLDLAFLRHCENNDLRILCDILTHDKKGRIRLNEQLMNKDSYIESYPDNMVNMYQDLASELQRYGGNTILNLYRHGRGPSYESIVEDVCRTMKVKDVGEHDTAEEMEQKLLVAMTSKMLESMDHEELETMLKELNIKDFDLTKQGVTAALLIMIRINKTLFIRLFNYIAGIVSRRLLGRGLVQIGTKFGERGAGFSLGPIAWVALTAWTVWDIAGPAYRVTVPAVMQVAMMRLKYNNPKIQAYAS